MALLPFSGQNCTEIFFLIFNGAGNIALKFKRHQYQFFARRVIHGIFLVFP